MRMLLLTSSLVIGLSLLSTGDAYAHGARHWEDHYRHHYHWQERRWGPRHRRHYRPHRDHWHGAGGLWLEPRSERREYAHRGYFGFYGSARGSGFAISVPLTIANRHTDHVHALSEAARPRSHTLSSRSMLPTGCRQTREFRTEVTIGGKAVPAYGTACLMPDGSWQRLGIDGLEH